MASDAVRSKLTEASSSVSVLDKNAAVAIGRNERSMPDDVGVKFPDDFLTRIDAGLIDEDFLRELSALTPEQRGELAQLLIERQARRARLN